MWKNVMEKVTLWLADQDIFNKSSKTNKWRVGKKLFQQTNETMYMNSRVNSIKY